MVAGLSGASFRWLPIVERELKVSARQKGLHWSRLLSVGVALILLAYELFRLRAMPHQYHGQVIFQCLMSLVTLQSIFSGVEMLDCISKEKREGTLGLLFLTSLQGLDVVLGKMMAGSLKVIYRLLAFLPVVAITFLLGGVAQKTYLMSALVCFSVALFSLCLAVFCSSLVRSFWAAFGLWLGGMMMLLFGVPLLFHLCEVILGYFRMKSLIAEYRECIFISPIVMFFHMFDDTTWGKGGSSYALIFTALKVLVLVSMALFFGACRWTVSAWKDKEKKTGQIGVPRTKWKEDGDRVQSSSSQWKLKDQMPVYWLITRYRSTKVIAITIIMAGLAMLSLFWLMTPEEERSLGWGVFIVGMGHLAVVVWMAAEAAAWTNKLRQSGELELLLTTPVPIRDFWQGYQRALWRKALVPVGLLLFAYWCFATSTTGQFYDVSDWVLRLAGIMLVGLLLPLNMLAAGWTGAWFGSFSKNEFNAAASAVTLVLGTAMVALLLVYLVVEITFGMPSSRDYFNHWASSYYYYSYYSKTWCFLLFCGLPWFFVLRASFMFRSWSRKHCQALRYAVQADELNTHGWRQYARIFLQSLYRRPQSLLEVVK